MLRIEILGEILYEGIPQKISPKVSRGAVKKEKARIIDGVHSVSIKEK